MGATSNDAVTNARPKYKNQIIQILHVRISQFINIINFNCQAQSVTKQLVV